MIVSGFFDGSIPTQVRDNFIKFLQCPPRWTTLRVIISPGKNPLPALALIKYSTDGDNEKFCVLAALHM